MHTKFKDTDQVHIQKKTVHGQKAPLHELIRTIMQNFREKGILAAENYNPENMTHHEVDECLQRLGISIPEDQEQKKTSSSNRATTSLYNQLGRPHSTLWPWLPAVHNHTDVH